MRLLWMGQEELQELKLEVNVGLRKESLLH